MPPVAVFTLIADNHFTAERQVGQLLSRLRPERLGFLRRTDLRQARQQLIDTIQSLSLDDGTRQPSAAAWLAMQDDKAKERREKDPGQDAGHEYLDSAPPVDD